MRLLLHSPYAPLVVFAVTAPAVVLIQGDAQTNATRLVELLVGATWVWLLVIWIDLDARFQRRRPCYDFGFLAYLTFPVSLVWYCVHSRGWKRGIATLLALTALSALPILVFLLYWLIWYGAR